MTFFLFILIIIFCLLAYYFAANEFVVKPLISKRKKVLLQSLKLKCIVSELQLYYTDISINTFISVFTEKRSIYSVLFVYASNRLHALKRGWGTTETSIKFISALNWSVILFYKIVKIFHSSVLSLSI